MYNIIYINQDKTTEIKVKNGVPYIVFKNLELPGIVHGFSTRLGGVSEGIYSTMNLSFHRGDDMDAVMENHRRLAQAVGYDHRRLVFSDQVHETVIRKVTEEDAGKGITRESDITETDGLMTNVKDLPLITFYADCVPVFFYDPVKEVVAMNHSGWRGTVKNISRHMVEALNKEYGCTLQVAGSDQWGNITAGIDLIRKKTGQEVYGFTMPLILDKFGNKFGKSEGNALWLDKNKTSSYEIYQYLVNTDDSKVVEYLKVFTFLSHEEINKLEEKVKTEPEKREAQQSN